MAFEDIVVGRVGAEIRDWFTGVDARVKVRQGRSNVVIWMVLASPVVEDFHSVHKV
jgi:hypothetical protein